MQNHNATVVDGMHRKAACSQIYSIKKNDIFQFRPVVWFTNLKDSELIALSLKNNETAALVHQEGPVDLLYFLR